MSTRLRFYLVAAIVFILLVSTVPHFAATSHGAYRLALATARQNRQFNDVLGPPIHEAWFSEGTTVWGDSPKADLLIPVRGRLRTGNLAVMAIKVDGRWHLTKMVLELHDPGRQIDLLPK